MGLPGDMCSGIVCCVLSSLTRIGTYVQWKENVSDYKHFLSYLAMGILTVVDWQTVTVGSDGVMQMQEGFDIKPANMCPPHGLQTPALS